MMAIPDDSSDAMLAVRLGDSSDVVLATFGEPDSDGKDFSMKVNIVDVGAVPSFIDFVRTDGGLRLAALVPSLSDAVLVDPGSTVTEVVDLPQPFSAMRRITAALSEVPAGGDVALLWGAGSSIAFWSLGSTSKTPYRSVSTAQLSFAVTEVQDVPAPNQHLKVLRGASPDRVRARPREPFRAFRSRASYPAVRRRYPPMARASGCFRRGTAASRRRAARAASTLSLRLTNRVRGLRHRASGWWSVCRRSASERWPQRHAAGRGRSELVRNRLLPGPSPAERMMPDLDKKTLVPTVALLLLASVARAQAPAETAATAAPAAVPGASAPAAPASAPSAPPLLLPSHLPRRPARLRRPATLSLPPMPARRPPKPLELQDPKARPRPARIPSPRIRMSAAFMSLRCRQRHLRPPRHRPNPSCWATPLGASNSAWGLV